MKKYKIFFLDHRSIYLNSLGDALCQLGNQLYYQSSWNFHEIEAGIAYFKPDILMTVGCDIPLREPTLNILPELCRKYQLFHIYWATEDLIHHDSWSVPFVQKIKPDLVWTIHPECVRKYENIGLTSTYLNFAFNPALYNSSRSPNDKIYSISLIGTTHFDKKTFRYESFDQLALPFIQEDKRVDIWGYGWHENRLFIQDVFGVSIPSDWLHGYLPYKSTFTVYHQSNIVLGLQNALDQVSQRTFEILGSGAFMLTNATPAIESMFEHGRDLILTSSKAETLDLAEYYYRHPEERESIGQSARNKVLKYHTYNHRLLKVWAHLERCLAIKKGEKT